MLIGIDGNEANVKQRVGSGQYAFELLRQFHLMSMRAKRSNLHLRHSGERSDSRIDSGQARMTKMENVILGSEATPESKKVPDRTFLIYLKEPPLPDLPQETENFKYKVFGPKKFWTQFALPIRLSVGERPQVFFSMAHYGPRFSKVPYVVTIHDLSYLHYPEFFKKNDLYQLTSWSKYSIENSVHIIAVSETTKKDIVKNYGVAPSKISVTYEGYDSKRFKPQSQSAIDKVKKRYGISGSYIIFVGTLQPRKNLERLIEAFSLLPASEVGFDSSEVSNLKLVIVGKKGWLYDSIFEKVKQLKLDDKVIFTDYVPDDDLPALIAGAKVYVLPSLWEGFGIPVIEAQACGVPTVVSNTSSLPEIIGAVSFTPEVKSRRHLENTSGVGQIASAMLVDPQNVDSIVASIKKVLIDEKTRSDLIKKGFANIKRFSWQKCAEQTLEVLEKVASK
ncbi:glycosyltransferase family 4 protein [Candidatus Curtissbacteria bacterium]|nr:glycosyltransferase family 4 protein [Candidatus Curtissbacteria bacterium]